MRPIALVLVALTACSGDDGPHGTPDGGPEPGAIVLPDVIAMPYIPTGASGATVSLTLTNESALDAHLEWSLTGDGFTLVAAPDVIAAGAEGTLTITWDGSATEAIAEAALSLGGDVTDAAEVWAVAGDPALEPATFDVVTGAGGVTIGDSAVVAMPTAPYASDDRVHVFVPEGYRQADAHDLVLHFHGHNTTIAATVPAHRYREQVYASGANVILVVPQGPVNAASGDFGRLSDPAGTAAFLQEVMIVLFRAGVITRPLLGDVILSSHSGGYVAVAQNLAGDLAIPQVQLYDSLYGYLPTYRAYAQGGGRLRSNYTTSGGTDTNNQTLAAQLESDGVAVADAVTQDALRDAPVIIYATPATHNGATREAAAFAEQLRWGARRGRRGPRAELWTAADGVVTWRAPANADVTGWRVEDGDGAVLAEVAADVTTARVDAARVRVVPVVPGVDDPQPTDTYAMAATGVVVVDGFDRVIDGSFGGLAHDFAARVADAAGGADTASSAAIAGGAIALADYRVVIWLVGDDSTDDHTFTAAERAAITAYVGGGGRVILSGSEIGYELGTIAPGFLTAVAGATYAADDAGTNTASGAGIATFTFGDAAAAYAEEFPDSYTGGTTLLTYATGGAAAVGVAGQGAIVGFPLETIADDAALASVVGRLIDFVDP